MELQAHKAEFEAAGIKLFAISYDTVKALRTFAEAYGIDFPILSDVDSKVIREFGILNTLVKPDETEYYGIPYPGSYLVGNDGLVAAKFFNRQYQVRETASAMMREGFGLPIDPAHLSHAEVAGGTGVTVHAELMAKLLHPRQRSLIYVTLELDEGLHVYGEPTPDDYMKTQVAVSGTEGLTFGPPKFPETHPFSIEGIDEAFHAYDGKVEIIVPVVSGIREEGSAEIEVKVSYQVCTDTMCFMPRTETLRLDLSTAPNVAKVVD